jgi:transposase-like protein
MGYKNIEEQMITFCYDGPSSFDLLAAVSRSFMPNATVSEVAEATQSVIANLIKNELIQFQESSLKFTVTSSGYQMAEKILISLNKHEFLREA